VKIFVDENIPFMAAQELLSLGHDVMDIRGTEQKGTTDKDLWKIVQKEKRLLITTDKGFVQNRYEKHHGLLIIRLKQPTFLHQVRTSDHFREVLLPNKRHSATSQTE